MSSPETGRWQRKALTEGDRDRPSLVRRAPSTTGYAGGPPPRAGPVPGRSLGQAASNRRPASSQFTTSHHALR